jgi:hypothetical protein
MLYIDKLYFEKKFHAIRIDEIFNRAMEEGKPL